MYAIRSYYAEIVDKGVAKTLAHAFCLGDVYCLSQACFLGIEVGDQDLRPKAKAKEAKPEQKLTPAQTQIVERYKNEVQ